MTRSELALLLDHSVLKPEAAQGDIRAGADIVRTWQIGFYCVQPCWVKVAVDASEAEVMPGADVAVESPPLALDGKPAQAALVPEKNDAMKQSSA